MKYTLVADTHLYSKYEVPGMREKVLALEPSPTTILLGDIVDLSCCDKKNIDEANRVNNLLKRRHGSNALDGNHNPDFVNGTAIVRMSVLFTHGDMEADILKWRKYREKHLQKQGAGWLKKLFIMNTVSLFNELVGGKPKPEFFSNAAFDAQRNNCHTYVGAHFHPKEMIDVVYNGIRIIVVKQGITEIEL